MPEPRVILMISLLMFLAGGALLAFTETAYGATLGIAAIALVAWAMVFTKGTQ